MWFATWKYVHLWTHGRTEGQQTFLLYEYGFVARSVLKDNQGQQNKLKVVEHFRFLLSLLVWIGCNRSHKMTTAAITADKPPSHRDDDSAGVTFHIVGDAYVDFFCFLDGDWPEYGGDSRLEHAVKCHAGGSSTNTATHLKALIQNFTPASLGPSSSSSSSSKKQPDVMLHTVLNPNDQYGHILLEHAEDHQFPIHNCRQDDDDTSSTGHCIAIISGGERSFMTHQGVVGNFDANSIDVDSIVGPLARQRQQQKDEGASVSSEGTHLHLHVAGFYNIPGFWNGKLKSKLEMIRQRRKELYPSMKTTISLVTQHDATKQWDGGLDEIFPLLEFVLMNDLEARSIIKRAGVNVDDYEHEHLCWASYFESISPATNVIVTRGEKGAICFRGGQILGKQKPIVVKAIDPTGAGDSFTAGFIYGLWSWKLQNSSHDFDEWPTAAIEEGMRWGVSVGSAAVMIRGASIPPEAKDIQMYLEQAKEPEYPVFNNAVPTTNGDNNTETPSPSSDAGNSTNP
jgi:sugar/nucleoside kinase (ribokinase family)